MHRHTHSLNNSLARSLTHSLNNSLTQQLTHSPLSSLSCWLNSQGEPISRRADDNHGERQVVRPTKAGRDGREGASEADAKAGLRDDTRCHPAHKGLMRATRTFSFLLCVRVSVSVPVCVCVCLLLSPAKPPPFISLCHPHYASRLRLPINRNQRAHRSLFGPCANSARHSLP